jgi:PAS domain S-box-containing protein
MVAAAQSTDLRKALDGDEIVPYFQPIVELRTGILIGFEALARWRHPIQGLVPPDVFIPLAEENGLIGILTRNLLRRVTTVAASLPEELSIAFNISPLQFGDRTLAQQIHSAAQVSGFSLKRLVLEITESALIGNIEQAQSIAQELKALGVSLALDDFGTGYSSLRHLQLLPFDELKIDANFVREMSDTKESRKIVAAIIGLGHSLSLTTVAEGIETKQQADMLLRLGCDIGQGWLYGPPVPPNDLHSFLSTQSLAPSSSASSSKKTDTDTLPNLEAMPTQRLAQLQTIYEGAPVGLCFLDRNLRYVNINKQLAEMNGVSIADHLGRTVSDVIPELSAQVEPYLRRVLQGETFTGLEFTSPKKNAEGHEPTMYVAYLPVLDEGNEVVGVSCAVSDITSRKLMEKALRESEEHYRSFVELNPQIPWTSDAQGRILTAGPRWEIVTGWTTEEALDHGWIKGLHPADVIPTLRLWASCLQTGEPFDTEYRIGRENSWRWMRARAAPRRNADGGIDRWYGTAEDIDDQKRAERALRESEALLRAVFDAVPVGLVISDSPGNRILMCNPRAEAIFRRSIPLGSDIDSYRNANLFHADGRPLKPEEYVMERALESGTTTEPEDILYRRDDGSEVWIRVTAAPVHGKNGGIGGAVVAIQDIGKAAQENQRLLDRIQELEEQLKRRL